MVRTPFDAARLGRGVGASAGLALMTIACSGGTNAITDAGIDAEVIGELTNQGSTMMEDVRIAEGGISNLMVDILLTEARARTGAKIDVAVLNGGAIRGGATTGPPDFKFTNENARIGNLYGPGPLTSVDVEGWFPFNDDHVLITLTGADIKGALEHSVSTFADDAGTTFGANLVADGGGPFLHVSGLSFEATCPGTVRLKVGPTDCDPFAGTCKYLNADKANTITKLTIGDRLIYDAAQGGWQNGGDTAEFRVFMNDFLAAGNDNHLDFRNGRDKVPLLQADWDFQKVLVQYVRTHSPITLIQDENRIQVIGEVKSVPCYLPQTCLPAHLATHPNCAHLR